MVHFPAMFGFSEWEEQISTLIELGSLLLIFVGVPHVFPAKKSSYLLLHHHAKRHVFPNAGFIRIRPGRKAAFLDPRINSKGPTAKGIKGLLARCAKCTW